MTKAEFVAHFKEEWHKKNKLEKACYLFTSSVSIPWSIGLLIASFTVEDTAESIFVLLSLSFVSLLVILLVGFIGVSAELYRLDGDEMTERLKKLEEQ